MKTRIYILTFISMLSVKYCIGQAQLIYLTANQSLTTIKVARESLTEINLDYYSVERSIDSINYISLANVAGGGNSTTPLSYYHIDNSTFTNACYYYKLKAVMFNGTIQYFGPVKVCYNPALSIDKIKEKLITTIYPNPVKQGVINIELPENENCIINIFNQLGDQILTTKPLSKQAKIDCSKFKSGEYYLQLIKSDGQISSSKFIVD